MIVASKEDLRKAVEVLKAHDRYNAAYVLEEALERFVFDDKHSEFVLQVKAVPTILEEAIEECCTTDCVKYSNGACPFKYDEKYKCYRIINHIEE